MVLCVGLEGWDKGGWEEDTRGRGYGDIYIYVELIHFVIQQKLT